MGKVDTDLLATREQPREPGSLLVARGTLYSGGVSIGLVEAEHGGCDRVDVTSRGPFTVVLAVPRAGRYWVGVANDLDMYTSLENDVVLDELGWVTRPR